MYGGNLVTIVWIRLREGRERRGNRREKFLMGKRDR